MFRKVEAATIFCRNHWKVRDKDGNVRAKIATGYFTIFQTWAVLKLKLISILSESDRIEINFTFKTAHVWKSVKYPVAILARTLPSLSRTFQ